MDWTALIKHGSMNKKGGFFLGFIGSDDKHDLHQSQPQPLRENVRRPPIF